ncbi:MAG: DUF2341 domain-containing protein [bacterium]|nr:DUF2341 domain-containing protein [bacterium]
MSLEKLFGSLYEDTPRRGVHVQPKKKQERVVTPGQATGFFRSVRRMLPSYWLRRARLSKKLYYYTVLGLVLLIGGGIFAYQIIFPKIGEAAWFDDTWLYRKAIEITAHTSAEQNVYINLTGAAAIDTSDTAKFQSDCGDLRFTDNSGNLLQYFIVSGCGTSSTVVHVNFESFPAGAQTIYYYYGNPGADNGFSLGGFPRAATSYTIGSIGSEENGPSPVAYWALDEAGSTVASSSASPNLPAQILGPTWQQPNLCVSGSCLFFSGTSQNVNAGDNTIVEFASGTTFSIGLWVRTPLSDTDTIIAKKAATTAANSGYMLTVDSSGTLVFYAADGTNQYTMTGTSAIVANKWYYIVVTYDKTSTTTTTIYVNGSDINPTRSGTLSSVGDVGVNSRELYFGSESDNQVLYKGFLDEVKIYRSALSSSQVKTNYSARGSLKGSAAVLGAQDQSYLSNGLVGYWKMDESASPAIDSSGNGNSGTWTGGATASSAAKFASGITLDGNGDYVAVANSSVYKLASNFTLSAWIKTGTSVAATGTIFSTNTTKNFGYDMEVLNTGIVEFDIGPGTQISTNGSTNLHDNTWHHVVGTYDGSVMVLYIDGNQVSRRNVTGSVTYNATALHIGTSGAINNYFNGVIDEVRIYNRGLSADEVANLYNFAPGPVGYWRFEEKQGITTVDSSGYGNSGTLINSPSWVRGKVGSALSFDGARSGAANATYVDIGDQSAFEITQFTIGAWVYRTGNCGTFTECTIFAKGTSGSIGYALDISDTSCGAYKVRLNLKDEQSVCGTTVIQPNTWYYVSASLDNDYLKVYVNGILEVSVTRTQTPTFVGEVAQIGNRNDGLDLGFSGSIDEVRFYNYVRSTAQIVQDMNGGHPGVGSPVGSALGYWKFDDGYGTVASNSGSLGGAADGQLMAISKPPNTTSGWSLLGKFGKALNFDGASDRVDVASSGFDDMPSFTLSAWINPRTFGGGGAARVFDKSATSTPTNGWHLFINSNWALRFRVDYSTTDLNCTTPNNTLVSKEWQHVLLTWDGTSESDNVHVYVNGKPIICSSKTDGIGSRVSDAGFHLNISSFGSAFDGYIDEAKVYNFVLTASEVKTEFNHGSSLVLGSFGTSVYDGVTASNSAQVIYCVPGDTTTLACQPVAEWRFEERRGDMANDTTGNNSNGKLMNTPQWTDGKVGSALLFDGFNQRVSVLDNGKLDQTSNLTISAWIKRNRLGTAQHIVNKGTSAYALHLDASNFVNLSMQGTGIIVTSTQAISDTTSWHYIAATWDGTTGKIYIDGKDVSGATTSHTLTVNATNLLIGSDTTPANFFNGKIDEVRLYNYALSPAQVAWNYNHGKPVAYWKFDECQGSTVNDSSGNGLSGTITIGGTGTNTGVGTCTTSSTAWGDGATGKYNYSLFFDGNTDSITSTANITSIKGGGFSTSQWVKRTGSGYVSSIFDSGCGDAQYELYFIGSGTTLSFLVPSSEVTCNVGEVLLTDNPAPIGTWTHIVGTFDGTNTKLYINGVLKGTDTTYSETFNTSPTATFNVSKQGSAGEGTFEGQIDDVQIFNYPLTPVQIRNVYNQSSAVRFGPLTGTP